MLSIINKALKRPLFIELKKTHSESEEYENDNAVVINKCENIKFCIPVKVVSSAEKLLNSLFDYLNYQEAPEFRGVARLDNFIMSHKNSILSL